MYGSMVVSRGPLYYKCVSQEMNNKQQEFYERIKELRASAEEKVALIDIAQDEKAAETVKRYLRERRVSYTSPATLPDNETPTIRFIREAICAYFDIDIKDLDGASREARLTWPRHVGFWMAYRYTGRSMPEIGRMFGGKDHTTVLNGIRRVEKRLLEGEEIACRDVREMRIAFAEAGVRDQFYYGA
jgi:chromosomal replication initiation ATPase DnaA